MNDQDLTRIGLAGMGAGQIRGGLHGKAGYMIRGGHVAVYARPVEIDARIWLADVLEFICANAGIATFSVDAGGTELGIIGDDDQIVKFPYAVAEDGVPTCRYQTTLHDAFVSAFQLWQEKEISFNGSSKLGVAFANAEGSLGDQKFLGALFVWFLTLGEDTKNVTFEERSKKVSFTHKSTTYSFHI